MNKNNKLKTLFDFLEHKARYAVPKYLIKLDIRAWATKEGIELPRLSDDTYIDVLCFFIRFEAYVNYTRPIEIQNAKAIDRTTYFYDTGNVATEIERKEMAAKPDQKIQLKLREQGLIRSSGF